MNPSALAAIQSKAVALALFVEMRFSVTQYLSSSAVDIEWDGHTWQRTGNLGSVDTIKDSAGDVTGLKFAISGVPSDNIALALGESARNKGCIVRLAVLDAETHALLDVLLLWRGVLDQMPISEGNGQATVAVTALHRAQLFRRPKPLRYTDDDQQRLYPGDKSLEYITSQSTHQDTWPAAGFFRK